MTDGYQKWKGEIKLSAVNDHEKLENSCKLWNN